MEQVQKEQGVAAIDRALAIVEALAAEVSPRTLAQLAAATGFYKSTILRLLGSLERGELVGRLKDGRYVLGAAAFRLGMAYERANPLRQHVIPVLQELVSSGTESASFHVRHGPETRLCLFREDSHHSTLDRVRSGDVLPLARGAAGRVILAFDGATATEYDKVRSSGFALSEGERDPGCAGLAAPVFSADGLLRGALSLSGPGQRFTAAMIATDRPKLLAAAAQLTRALGGRQPEFTG
jgi:DNA-binding IclR family transcriptional regulator